MHLHYACLALFTSPSIAFATAPVADPLPVREITAFKDGHAYVLREQPHTGTAGTVVLDRLPTPILGTFWPYGTGGAKVVSAVAGKTKVEESLDALDFAQLVEANIGRTVTFVIRPTAEEADERFVIGKVLAIPSVTVDGVVQRAAYCLVETDGDSTTAVPFDGLRRVIVSGDAERKIRRDVERERLTLRIEGGGADARVGVVYVEKGFRWIPAYKVDVDGAGKANVQLEATLVNDLIDLQDATVNLVVGVPSIAFEGITDPIALQLEVASVARAAYFPNNPNVRLSNALSNSVMSQTTWSGGETQDAAAAVPVGTDQEDLYVFTVPHVTLAKGERMVLPIASFAADYRDRYELRVPIAPPDEPNAQFDSTRDAEMTLERAAPKVRHLYRLRNGSPAPITTAPALVLSRGRILAQSRAKYTPAGAEWDLDLTTAVDIGVKVESEETGRTPNGLTANRKSYQRVDVSGQIELANSGPTAVEVDVVRYTFGRIDSVDSDGTSKQLDAVSLRSVPDWNRWTSSWPSWWFHLSGSGEARWKVRLEPGARASVGARWHYFWD